MRTQQRMLRLTTACVQGVRLGMGEQGFALVDPPLVVPDDLLRRVKERRTVLPFQDQRWSKFPELARYAYWLERLLHEALREEAVSLATLELRQEPAGSVDPEVDRLHADGSYIRSVASLYGLPTLYLDGEIERPVPEGQTLLMTAHDRTRAVRVSCTLHRRPGAGPERALIVCSFEPRPKAPKGTNVFRQVAQAPRERGWFGRQREKVPKC